MDPLAPALPLWGRGRMRFFCITMTLILVIERHRNRGATAAGRNPKRQCFLSIIRNTFFDLNFGTKLWLFFSRKFLNELVVEMAQYPKELTPGEQLKRLKKRNGG